MAWSWLIAVPVVLLGVWWWATGFHGDGDREHRFVYIDEKGASRELTPDERDYLNTKFHGADGARPYIKSRYRERNGHGNLSGFLRRRHLPRRVPVGKA
jgi:hypothetical protein